MQKQDDAVKFSLTLDGRTLAIVARNFVSDRSVGIEFGPDEITATDADGNDVDIDTLSPAALAELYNTANDAYYSAYVDEFLTGDPPA